MAADWGAAGFNVGVVWADKNAAGMVIIIASINLSMENSSPFGIPFCLGSARL
jgi:hypothetical protein